MSDIVYCIEKVPENRFLRSEPTPQRSAVWCNTAEFALSWESKDEARNVMVRITPRVRGHLHVTPIEVV